MKQNLKKFKNNPPQQQSEPSGLVARPIVSRGEVVNFPDGPEVTNYQDVSTFI